MLTSVSAAVGGGLSFLILLETFANTAFINDFLRNPTKPVDAKPQLDLGVSTPDVVVIVTALLVLVATLNVALAAFLIKDEDTVTGSVKAFTWASVAAFTGRASGAISFTLALTRLPEDLPLGLLLLGLTAMTVTLTGSITPRERLPQYTLRDADLTLRRDAAAAALSRYDVDLVRRRSKRQPTLPRLALRLAISALPLAVINTLLFLGAAALTDVSAAGKTPPEEWLWLALWVARAIGPFLLLFVWFFSVIRVSQLQTYKFERVRFARVIGWGYWTLSVGFFALLIATSKDKSPMSWVLTAGITLLPAALVWVASWVGSAAGPSPRAHYLGIAFTLTQHRLRELEASVSSNRKALEEAEAEADASRWRRGRRKLSLRIR